MKKKISYLFMVVLIACSLIMPCVADEPTTELVTELTTELVTDVLEEMPAETTPEETSAVEETTPEEVVSEMETTTPDVTEPVVTEPQTSIEEEWEMFKAKITDSSVWTMIGTGFMTVLSIVVIVAKKFNVILDAFRRNADEDTIKGELKSVKDDLKGEYIANHKEISAFMERCEAALKNTEENEQKMYAILTLFMTNCKISESAKAEILNILADVKKYSGDVSEFVAQAQEAIDNDIAENQKNAPPTPTLDQMLEEDYMELG